MGEIDLFNVIATFGWYFISYTVFKAYCDSLKIISTYVFISENNIKIYLCK